MRTILVTGGAGYIGSHACRALAAAGWLPVTYDNLSAGHEWAVRWGPLERGDIRDADRLREVLERHRPQAVMHFAGLIAVGESVEQPARYYDNNVTGTLRMLDVMRDAGIGTLVFSSTCAIYGQPAAVPIAEDTPPDPLSPYGASKLMIERVLADYSAAYGLRYAALRYFNACGASPEADIGEDHQPETHLIPLVLDAAAGRRASIKVFGDDYATPDGTCLRDYIHVCDLADAHVAAVEKLCAGAGSFAVNLGTGRGISVAEIIAAARRVTGRDIPVEVSGRRAGDPAALVSDVSRSREVLPGWTPTRSTIDTILEDAWRWHSRHFPAGTGTATG